VAGDGQSFSFSVTLTTTHPFYGFSLFLESSAANAFSVTGETAAGNSPITDPNFVGSFPVLLTTAANSSNFAYSSTGISNIAAGSYSIGTLTISVGSNVSHGSSTITTTTRVTGSEYNDVAGNIYPLPQATETVTVPEPTPVAAMAILAAFLYLPEGRRTIRRGKRVSPRVGAADEISSTAVFLCSDAVNFITGEPADGGGNSMSC
jgi:hypothetical protein